jgi:hypothetical protein
MGRRGQTFVLQFGSRGEESAFDACGECVLQRLEGGVKPSFFKGRREGSNLRSSMMVSSEGGGRGRRAEGGVKPSFFNLAEWWREGSNLRSSMMVFLGRRGQTFVLQFGSRGEESAFDACGEWDVRTVHSHPAMISARTPGRGAVSVGRHAIAAGSGNGWSEY